MLRGFLLISAFILLAACSESHNQGNLQVVNQSPAIGAEAVATNTTISVTFSEAIDRATVNSSNFKLLNQSGQVEGMFKINGNTVTFTPSDPLFLFSKYSVTVSPTIYGTSGQIMPQSYQWEFTTRDGVWNTKTAPQGADPNTSRAAIDDNGRVLLAWSTTTGAYSSFLDSGTWTTPVLLGQSGDISNVIAANDRYAVFWQGRNGNRIQLYCARYTDGAWQAAETLTEVDATAIYVLSTMFSDNSLFMIYWFYGGADGYHAYSRRFDTNQGWQTPVALAGQAGWYVAGFHRSGKAVIAWESPDGSQSMGYAQNYDISSGWSTPVAIGQYAYLIAHSATVNSSGQSMVAFSSASNIRIASNTLNTGWTQLAPVYQSQSDVFYSPPQIAMDNLGNVMLVARESFVSPSNRYFAIRYDSTSGWQQPVDISGGKISDIMQFRNTLKVDESGNYLLVWQGFDTLPGIEHVYSSRYQNSGTGWDTPVYLGRQDADTLYAKIAMNQRGEAVAVWSDFYPPTPADFTMSLGVGFFK